MQKRWFIKEQTPIEQIEHLQSSLKVSSLMAKLLAQRGFTDETEIRSYFKPTLEQLHDPFLMKGMADAVSRIQQAIDNNEHILVFGDYDVDGTTAVALVYSILKHHTTVSYYIPDRYEEGYGISTQGIEYAKTQGSTLIIALDCGIKAHDKVDYAKTLGIDFIICDHHLPAATIPDCIVLDPKQSDCSYPYDELCGCGVGFKLMEGLYDKNAWDKTTLYSYLDLVAIAIGADIVPVTGENRVLCKLGLEVLNNSPRLGIQALLTIAKRNLPLELSNVVFVIAPRINAAGRLESGKKAVELLLAETASKANSIAEEIEEYNSNRRILDAQITEEALRQIEADETFAERKSTVVFQPDWHKGVVGIVASRLIEKYHRPTIVLTESKGIATGSARSVVGINMYEALESCSHLLTQFGGHAFAAGMTLPKENVSAFSLAFEDFVRNSIDKKDETHELIIDTEIQFSDLFVAGESTFQVPRIFRMLEQMEPFGPENTKPVFCVKGIYANDYKILQEAHLKLSLQEPKSGITLQAIGFKMGHLEDLVTNGCAFDCAFTLEANTWKEKTTIQLQVRDIREH